MLSIKRYFPARAILHGLTILGILFAAAASASPAYAIAPANDLITKATNITTVNYGVTLTNVDEATESVSDPILSCVGNQGKDSVWFTFTPSSSGEVSISTANSGYDTVLALFSGGPGGTSLTELGCNNNSGGQTSALKMLLRGGVKYYVEVVRKSGTTYTTKSLKFSYSYANKVVAWGTPAGKNWDSTANKLFTYSAGWQLYPVLGALNGNIQISNNVNNNAVTYFDGIGVDITYALKPNSGNLEVYVDNVLQATIAQNAAFNYPQVWSSPAYSDGVHQLELRHTVNGTEANFDYITVYSFPDVIPPSQITNLTDTVSATTGKVTLKWKAPGDDGNVGTAAKYHLRYFVDPPIIDCIADWASGTPYTFNMPLPAVSGTNQQVTLEGLAKGEKYYFCIAAEDEAGNLGTPSNRTSAIPTATPQFGTGTYDDAHPGWKYAGNWELVNDPDARYNTVHVSSKIGDTASFAFTGTQFVFTYLTSPIGGLMDVYIDGVLTTTIDQYTYFPNSFYYTSPILANGPHVVRFEHMTQVQVTVDQLYVWKSNDGGSPDPITDLAAVPGANDGEVDLTFTATGDDGNAGSADKYEIRYSPNPINNLVDWDFAESVAGVIPPPSPAGTPENITVGGLTPGATYYFAVRAFDDSWFDVLSNTVASQVQYTGAYQPNGFYQENHSTWQFSTIPTGWVTITDVNASGGAYRRITNAPAGSLARFWFNGTKFRLFFLKDVNYGKLVVYVDGKKRGTINQSNSVPLWKQYWESPVFAAGNHVVEFRVVGSRANIDYIRIYP
jgi:hypothetical protein